MSFTSRWTVQPVAVVLAATMLALVGCESSPNRTQTQLPVKSVDITATDYAFSPATLRAQPGQPMQVRLINRGNAPHNIEFELPQGEVELDSDIQQNQSATLSFTAPQEPGRYTYYCPVANHEDRGMVGTLIVQ